MSYKFTKLICLLVLFFCIGLDVNAQKRLGHDDDQQIDALLKNYEKKIYFTQNKGQWPENILYKADFYMGQAQATKEGMLVGTFDQNSLFAFHDQANRREEVEHKGLTFNEKQAELKGHGWLMKFLNSSPAMNITNKTAHSDKMNFFIGDDTKKHATDVSSYNEIWYNEVYKNTDVRYYPSEHGTLEYDIICKPGSQPKEIELLFEGIEKKYINNNGELVLQTSVGDMTIAKPIAYQKIEGKEVEVDVKYVLNEKGALTFDLGRYNSREILIIDPIALVWATWVSNNASSNSHGHGIQVEVGTGDIYVVGWYNSTGLITVNAFQNTVANGQDMIIGKYREPSTVGGAGTRIWQTYLGGTGTDNPYAIDEGPDGLYITGVIPATGTIPYPMIGGSAYGTVASPVDNRTQGGNNVFITKINSAGNSIKSCVVGGGAAEAIFDIRAGGIAGQVVVCGSTQSTNLATLWPSSGASNTNNGGTDVFTFKVSQDMNSLIWIRNFGGSGADQANIMLSEPTTGDIYIAGSTASANFPTLIPRQGTRVASTDGFIMKMNGNGVVRWRSYYNGVASGTTSILCMEFNTTRNKIVFGGVTTGLAASNISSGTYQTSLAGGDRDFHIGCIDTNQTFNWSTYIGGTGSTTNDNMMGLNLDLNNDVYIFGYTAGTHPVTSGAFEATKPGGNDKVFSKLSANGTTLLYSTYYGTSGNETDPVGERGIKFNDCRIYTIVTSNNMGLPLTEGAITTNKISSNSVLEMGIVEWGSPPPLANNGLVGNQVVCTGSIPGDVTGNTPNYVLPNISRQTGTSPITYNIQPHPALGGISSYQWQQSFDSGVTWSDIPGATSITLPGNMIGPLMNNMRIRRIISGDLCVISTDNNIITFETFAPTLTVVPSCQGTNNGQVNVTANGGTPPYTYAWSNGTTGSSLSNLPPGVYTLTITDATGCSASSTVTVPEYPDVNIQGSPNFCAGGSTTLTATPNVPGATYLWNGPGVTGATSQSITVSASGAYSVTVTFPQGCTQSASTVASEIISPSISISEVSGVNNNDGTLCAGESAVLTANPGPIYSWNTGAITQSITVTTAGTYTVTVSGGGGCNGTASATITVNPNPTPAISGPAGICLTQSATLSATGGTSYLWAPFGQTTAAITTSTPGTYSVTATNAFGCSALASAVLVRNNCLPTAANDAASTIEDTPVNIFVLTNDNFGADGPSTGAITVITPSANGTATVNTNGTPNDPTDDYITFTPNANYNGVTSFTYQICDANGDCVTATVTVTVTAVNDPPVAVNDNATTNEDTPVNISILANDYDVDGSLVPSTITIGTPPTHGTLSINTTTGVVTYTPSANYNGPDSFTYTVCDNGTPLPSQCSNVATVNINVLPVNDPPIVNGDNVTTPEDTPIAISVLANDSDLETVMNPGSVAVLVQPAHGTVSINNITGVITYTPNANYNGTDSFIYQACDQGIPLPALCDTAVVTITITPVNDPPIVVNDNATTNEDTPVVIPVTANDSDIDGAINPATVTVVTPPANGTTSVDILTGNVTYTPNPNFNGTDTFVYQVCDTGTPLPAQCSTATVTVTVNPVNDPPVAVDDNVSTNEDTPIIINVLANDSDIDGALVPGSVAIGTSPTNGTVTINAITGAITYTPNPNFNGTDVFTYQVCDNGTPLPALCDTATVTVTVVPVNDPPVAVLDRFTTNEDTPVSGTVATNDSDIDGPGPLSYSVYTAPTNGTVVLNNDGTFTYTPGPNYNGTDSFIYQLCDGATPLPGLCDTALVIITILPVNDPPVAVNDTVTTPEDVPIPINVLGNDSDVDGILQTTSVAIVTAPAHGSVSINAGTGVITYTPNLDYNGNDSFSYIVCDNGTPLPALCDTAVVYITITPVNDPVIITVTPIVTDEDTPSGTVCYTINDDPGDTHTATLCGVTNGTATATVNNGTNQLCVTFTPAPDYYGPADICIIVCDDGVPQDCDTIHIPVTVLPINDPPVANPDFATTNEDTPVSIPVLANDTDIDGSLVPNTVAVGTPPTNGTVSINNVTGVITYTPNANFNGTDTFVYQVCDNGTPLPSLCDTALVTVTVLPVNDPPIVVNDNATTNEDTPVVIPVTANDSDIDGAINPATVTVVTPPVNGTTSVDTLTGNVTYTPNPNFNGTDTFTYQVCDTGTPLPAQCSTATVTVTVLPINDPPVANPDFATTNEDTPVSIPVLANDTDVDGSLVPNTVVVGIPPTNGTVSINNVTGVITYTPNANFNGTDTFVYQVCDNGTPLPSLCDTALVTVTVLPVNDPPIVVNDNATTNEDTPIAIPVLANDSDIDGGIDPTSVTISTPPANGTVNVNPTTGVITYTPNPNFNGTDTFVYQVCDLGTPLPAQCSTATVTVTVIPVNDPPIVNADYATTNEDTPVTINVLANDTDVDGALVPNSVATVTLPLHGTVTINSLTGAITYTPAANYNGTDSFIYIACDNGTPLPSQCDTAVVYITINPVNDPPIANDDNYTTNEDTPFNGNVSLNDSDPDGPGATYTVLTGPSNGTLLFDPASGTFTYTPNLNFNGTDIFTYQRCDGGTPNLCDSATVTITVLPVNDPPIVVGDNVTTPEDTPIAINVLTNDSDLETAMNPGSVAVLVQPTHGTVSINNITGVITYTPNANYNGTDSFIYQACDQGIPLPPLCDTAVVTITITPVNDPPIANNDFNSTPEDTPVSGTVVTNDSDPDGPSAIYTLIGNPTHGTVVLNANGTYTYTPNANYNGTDVFTYQLCDGGTPNLCDTATVTITIVPVNDPPVINFPDVTTPEDTPVTVCSPITDPDVGDTFTASFCNPPFHGTVTGPVIFAGQVCFTYTPALNYNGLDSVCVILCDQFGACDTSVSVINVLPVNDPPVAVNDVNTTPEDTLVSGDASTNDSDVDGPGATYTVTVNPTNGTVTMNTNGTYTYTPNPNYNGTDVFTYQVCDGGTPNLCATATVTITVTPVNDPPIVNADYATTNEDTPVTINVLTNDTDIDGVLVPNSVAIVQQPLHGTVSVNAGTGAITYTPNPNYNGTDSLIYIACDNGTPLPSLCDTAYIYITINPVNDPPIAVNDNVTTPEDTPIVINVLGNDTDVDGNLDPTTVGIVTGPTSGTVTVNPITGAVTYTPNLNFNGTDVFTYVVCDTGTPIYCDTATVTITVTPVNDPPVINFPPSTTPEDTPVTICTPIVDPDVNNTFTATLCGGPFHGTVSGPSIFNGQVCITYTPTLNYNGLDSVCVIVCDQNGACDTSTTVITVTPVNDPPVAVNDNVTTPEDTPIVINVLGNDTDVDGNLDPTTVGVVTTPTNGTVSVNPSTGVITYTPNLNFNGTDVFTYVVCDTGIPVYCDTATVTITVTPVNDPPVINIPDVTTPEDTPITVCSPITDPDVGNTFNAGICGGPYHGTVVGPTIFNGQVCITYTPAANYTGLDSVCVIVCDNFGACDTNVVVITVTPVNDPPIANDDVATTTTGTSVVINVISNDTDIDGGIDPTSVTIITPPTSGTVSVNPVTGTVTYTPNANACGTDTFVYQVCDLGTPLPALCDQATVTITITDTQAPILTCPANFITSNTANQCGYYVTTTALNATATDNCTGPVTVTHNYFAWPNPNSLQGATFPTGTTTVVWTAVDAAGNSSICTMTVTVNDTQAPQFVNCQDGATITLGIFGGGCSGGVVWPVPTANDNCPGVTVTQTQGPVYGSTQPAGTYPIQYVATDASGNTDTCSFTLVLVDSQNPSIVCPSNTVVANANTGVCSWTAPANSLSPLLVLSNCGTTVTWTVQNPDGTTNNGTNDVSGYTFAVGTSTVTYTITETTSGQSSSCTFTVTVVDNQAPSFIGCPTNITQVNTPGVCGANVTWTPPTPTDNCPGVTVTSSHNPGDFFPVGTTQVTYTVRDAANNTSVCTFSVTVNDTQVPVLNNCPTNVTVTSTPGVCGAVVNWTAPTVTENCAYTLTSNHNSGEVFPVGTTTVIYTVIDSSGNTATCSFTITVTDVEAPVFVNCPSQITVSNFFNTCYQQVYWQNIVATDNCGSGAVTISYSHAPGTVFPVGTTTVTYTATDAAGNSTTCTFDVVVQDTQLPTIQGCPPSVTVNASNACNAIVNWATPTVFDNCPGVTLASTHNSGTAFPLGTTTVTYTATDVSGNIATCTFTVTVVDNQAPVITGCPANIVQSNTPGSCGATVTWTPPTVTDNCAGVTMTSSHLPGSFFPLGITTVTYTATDAGGNVTTCSFTVRVNDTQAPVITNCPANISQNNTAGVCGATVTWTPPTITDNCPGVIITSTHTPGATFPVGTTTVTYTATDAAGNVSTCSFTVIVTDTEQPTVSGCPTNISVNNAFNICGAPVFWTPPTFTDNCSGLTVTSTHTPGTTFPIGTTTVTYTATDASGNTRVCSFNISVNDTQLPTIIGCPGNITVNSGNACTATASWTAPSAIDNCPAVTLTSTHTPGASFPVGTTTVTYTATDASGNTRTCSFTVTVIDASAPVFTNCPTNIVASTDPGTCGAAVAWTPPTATDNCTSTPTVTSSHTPGFVFPVGTTTVTYTATDASGNTATCTFLVTVNDTQAPVFAACPTNISVSATTGCTAVATWTAPTATDNCSAVTITSTHNSGASFSIGVTTVTYTATDVSGNISTCSFTVTVTDTQAPVVTNCPANILLPDQFNTCGRSVTWTPPTFTDNCSTGLTVVASHVPGTFFTAGTTTVTYTATDASGNSTVCTFTITIVDQQIPQIASCPINATINSNPGICGAVYSWVLPTAFDNCPGMTLTSNHSSGDIFPVGTTNVLYTATDVSGNTATCTFNVTVLDVELPIISGCPTNITVSNTPGNCDGIATWTPPTASDNCSVVSFTSTHNSGDVFPVGTTAVTYTAVDPAGNTRTCTFNVTVNDTELPVVTGCPSDITTNNVPGTCGATATWTAPIATDNCSTGFTFTSNHNSGDTFPVGTTAVVYTAMDAAGNVSTCTFNVTVNDTELPVITGCPANINSCTDTITWVAPTATDNCNLVSFTSSHTSGSIFPVGTTTVVYTATDSAGNVSTCSFNVTVSKPRLTMVYTDVTCNGQGNGTATAIVTDAVGPLTFNWGTQGTDSLITNLSPGTYVLTVSDGIGCTVTDSVTITEPEELAVVATSVSIATCGLQDGNVEVVTVGGTKPYSYSWTGGYTTQNLNNVNDGTYHLTVTDANGCTDTLTVTIDCKFGRIPQLLTPNGDGHNDTWVIPGINYYPNAVVEVYNRWGNLVFKASPYNNDWNGISQGMLDTGKGELPAGTYFYVIKLNPSDKYAMTGYLELTY